MLGGLFDALKLILEIINGAKWLAGFIQDNKEEKWFKQSSQLFDDLRKATTPDEKKLAASRIRDLLRGLP